MVPLSRYCARPGWPIGNGRISNWSNLVVRRSETRPSSSTVAAVLLPVTASASVEDDAARYLRLDLGEEGRHRLRLAGDGSRWLARRPARTQLVAEARGLRRPAQPARAASKPTTADASTRFVFDKEIICIPSSDTPLLRRSGARARPFAEYPCTARRPAVDTTVSRRVSGRSTRAGSRLGRAGGVRRARARVAGRPSEAARLHRCRLGGSRELERRPVQRRRRRDDRARAAATRGSVTPPTPWRNHSRAARGKATAEAGATLAEAPARPASHCRLAGCRSSRRRSPGRQDQQQRRDQGTPMPWPVAVATAFAGGATVRACTCVARIGVSVPGTVA